MTKLFLAGTESDIRVMVRLQVPYLLISYFTVSKRDITSTLKSFKTPPEIFLDSGAFSAYTQKKDIDIYKYCDYIKKHRRVITTYANLDVIGDAEKTWTNQQIMEKEGLSPLPTFHQGEPIEYLERYCKKYDYIALGGMVGTSSQKKLPWLKKCFRLIPKKTRVHGFGMTAPFLINLFPWYSVDSTSWNRFGRFGIIEVFNKGRMNSFSRKQFERNFRKKLPNSSSKEVDLWNLIQWKKYADYLESDKI